MTNGGRILVAHDKSCYGNASLGIAEPILTAAGLTVVSLPTVLLSSTTDIDSDPVAVDTTEWMKRCLSKWKQRGMTFAAVYTGWLGHHSQVSMLSEFCRYLRNSQSFRPVVFVDPVMGDGGTLYPCQTEVAKVMPTLVAEADVIFPNPTEAALLIGESPARYNIHEDGLASMLDAYELAKRLTGRFPNTLAIITSVIEDCADFHGIGCYALLTPQNTRGAVSAERVRFAVAERITAPSTSGTGDLFASLVIARWFEQTKDTDRPWRVVQNAANTVSKVMRMGRDAGGGLPFRKLLHLNDDASASPAK